MPTGRNPRWAQSGGVVEAATQNSATVQALLDNLIERGLIERGLDPEVCRRFIVDGTRP